jgi:hypothetical protein
MEGRLAESSASELVDQVHSHSPSEEELVPRRSIVVTTVIPRVVEPQRGRNISVATISPLHRETRHISITEPSIVLAYQRRNRRGSSKEARGPAGKQPSLLWHPVGFFRALWILYRFVTNSLSRANYFE